MNLKVDKYKCISCGQCVSINDNVFEFDDDNQAKVIQNPVSDKNLDDAKAAVEACPTGAIEEE